MSSPRSPRRARAFTLIELLMVLVVVALLAAGAAMPLSAQVQGRRIEQTRRILDTAREALLGFAVAHGRLPCPATESSRGFEGHADGGDAANGRCARFDGYLPAAELGLSGLDEEGYLRDAWGTKAHRVRYAVHGGDRVNGIDNPFTRSSGMQSASLAALAAAPRFLAICASGAGSSPTSCGPAANQLTRRAVYIVYSLGENALQAPASGSDESRNLDADSVFVSRPFAQGPVDAFDDQLTWVSLPVLAGRMVAAGALP